MYATSQHFQLVYFSSFAIFQSSTYCYYGVGSLDDRSIQAYKSMYISLRSWASKNGGENIQFLYKYDTISLFGQICQRKAPCTPVRNGAGLLGAQPPPFEKHGQGSEHTGFLQPLNIYIYISIYMYRVVFASCLQYEIAGGWGGRSPPPFVRHGRRSEHVYLLAPL